MTKKIKFIDQNGHTHFDNGEEAWTPKYPTGMTVTEREAEEVKRIKYWEDLERQKKEYYKNKK